MDAALPALSAQSLLEHEHFVRAVARGLLGDAHAAEDVAQETWLRGLQRAPGEPGVLQAWLASVTRNLARDARRGAARRTRREEQAARAEAQESVDAAYQRLSVQRDVAGAILELSEPYRSVVLLRYYHELEPAAIAVRLGAKPATVRTQLARAHELLRARLDARYGRESWAALLLPAAAGLPSSSLGTLPLALLAGAAALGVAAYLVARPEPARGAITLPVARLEPVPPSEPPPAELEPPAMADARRESPDAQLQEPAEPIADSVQETLFAQAELLDRGVTQDYQKATYSFEHGLRDDPGLLVTRNDWDLQFSDNAFSVTTITDDCSLIADLGKVPLAGLGSADLEALQQKVNAVALGVIHPTPPKDEHGRDQRFEPVLGRRGHSYFVWTRDANTDQAAAFEVLALEANDRCTLEWYATSDGRRARGSLASPAAARSLSETLVALRASAREAQRKLVDDPSSGFLHASRIVLQVRAGAGGGNPNTIDMAGRKSIYVRQVLPDPLDLTAPVDIDEESRAYASGGFLPPDQVFVVTSVSCVGTTRGDGNGHGGLRVVVDGKTLLDQKESPDEFRDAWAGRIELTRGDEKGTYLEVRNSSCAEAVLNGFWRPLRRDL